MKRTIIISALVCIAALFGISRAEMYKWVDKDGVMHWSDGPSDFNDAENITITDEIESSGMEDEKSGQDDQTQQIEDAPPRYTEELKDYTQQDEQEGEEPPDVVEIPDTDNVYVVPDTQTDLFFWNGWWWRQEDDRWYCSHYYNQAWVYYSNVPRFYFNVDPDWRRCYRDQNWHGHPWNHKRISGRRLQQDWKSRNNNRHWEGQATRGIQSHQPQPQQRKGGITYQRKEPYHQKPEVQQHPQSVNGQHDPKTHNNPGKVQQHPQSVYGQQGQPQQQHHQPLGEQRQSETQHQKFQGKSGKWDKKY